MIKLVCVCSLCSPVCVGARMQCARARGRAGARAREVEVEAVLHEAGLLGGHRLLTQKCKAMRSYESLFSITRVPMQTNSALSHDKFNRCFHHSASFWLTRVDGIDVAKSCRPLSLYRGGQ